MPRERSKSRTPKTLNEIDGCRTAYAGKERSFLVRGSCCEETPARSEAGLEREIDTISKMARAFRKLGKTRKASRSFRQIEARCTQLREWIKEWGDVALRESR